VYHPNGTLALSQNYTQATLEGLMQFFYPSGDKESLWTYDRGARSGPYILWRPSGEMEEEGSFFQDQQEGNIRRWYSSGMPSSDAGFLGGTLHGVFRVYGLSGALIREMYTLEGIPHSRFEYHGNGNLKSVQIYDGENVAMEFRWNSMGVEKINEENLEGTYTKEELYPNGNIHTKVAYKHKKKHGISWIYGHGRKVLSMDIYDKGNKVISRLWNPDQELSNDALYKNGKQVLMIVPPDEEDD
jgi:antitoxin component YwqK of YwqJK toxin-antitoxin module